MLSCQKLDVYQCAIQFIALVALLIGKLPRGFFFLTDEWKRASVSIPQNIAEGVGKPTVADRSRYFGIVRGSAMECGAILDVGATLTRISHQVSTAAADPGMSTALRSVGFLDVL